ncbi:MAG: hypothetical protein M3Y28_08440 [Armatimonadota bacterium]|nr:hypothetical protein [Armatimonadota bacterium]
MQQLTRLGCLGAVLGALALFGLSLLSESLEPGRSSWWMLFCWPILGASLGAMTQRALVFLRNNDFKEAGMSSLVSVVCYLPLYLFYDMPHPDFWAMIVAVLPLAWVVLLIVGGITMLIVDRF